MRQSLVFSLAWAGLASAHGHVKEYVIDGTTYPAFDPLHDYDAKFNISRIEWGFPKTRRDIGPGVSPVDDVNNLEITCRFRPLKEPGLEAVARAGASVTFKWLDWFSSHKGPVMTYMGLLPESGKLEDVGFFKIDEATYDPKTMTWGSDWLMKNQMSHTVTIPGDIKPGTYVIRHEIISLHNALNDDFVKKISGAQFYPQCVKVKVLGDGTAAPPTVKFPGGYAWDEKGLLINIFYSANEYFSPGPPLYKPAVASPPKGAQPVVRNTGALTGQLAADYEKLKAKTDTRWEGGVHGTDAKHPGGGGCIWQPGADPKTAKCTSMNTVDPRYVGFAQPPQSPAYVDPPHSDRTVAKFGPIIKYLFDPTQPRWEERLKKSGKVAAVFSA